MAASLDDGVVVEQSVRGVSLAQVEPDALTDRPGLIKATTHFEWWPDESINGNWYYTDSD